MAATALSSSPAKSSSHAAPKPNRPHQQLAHLLRYTPDPFTLSFGHCSTGIPGISGQPCATVSPSSAHRRAPTPGPPQRQPTRQTGSWSSLPCSWDHYQQTSSPR
uniref:Uncharacterized protein n=1 Tax=Setaria viridis TaxID=4556 RepID=A0A4U6TDZ3_SETVI|nr:hypothetical protein SEVIR_8G104350v2 [Setaria viridis]